MDSENPLVDAVLTRRHIARLMKAGLSHRQIGVDAGIPGRTVSKIFSGSPRVRRSTEASILKVSPVIGGPAQDRPENSWVAKERSVERLGHLLAAGWPHATLTEKAGVDTASITGTRGRRITLKNHHTIADLYRDLWWQPGPSAGSKGMAAKRWGHQQHPQPQMLLED